MRKVRIAASLLLNTVAVAVLGSAPPAAADSCSARNPFTPALRADLARRWPGNRFTAEALDVRTGCRYALNPQLRITTASVLKVQVMAGVLLRAQRAGRPLTDAERSRIEPMITQSANPPTSELWSSLGGVAGMEALDGSFAMSQTTHASPWGLTSTSAHDQVELTRQVLLGQYGPLNAYSRGIAHDYMTHVVPSQRWGISAGVPAGWTVALKNGFASSQCCRWRINSTGFVYDPNGGGYALTILTDGWATQAEGITGNETVARAVSAKLTRPVDIPVVGDWDHNARDDLGVYRNGRWHLRNSSDVKGYTTRVVGYGGAPGDIPIVGDWDGNGRDDLGIYRNGRWHLRNSSDTEGGTIRAISFGGQPGDIPIVGDWGNDGRDDLGIYRNGRWYLRSHSWPAGYTTMVVDYGGAPGDIPIVGDWDGNDRDDLGIYRNGRWHLRSNSSPAGYTLRVVGYGGAPGDEPVVGNWDGRAHDCCPGINRDGRWHLRSSSDPNGYTTRIVGYGS